MKHHDYSVYILTNSKKTVLYVGVTNNLATRLKEHMDRRNPLCFTARYNCHFLVHLRGVNTSMMQSEEKKELKGWSRAKKVALVESDNKNWAFLNNLILE